MKKIIHTTRYGNDDADCSCDYYEVILSREDGTEIRRFGDYYHDKGREKAEGFIDGLKLVYPALEVEYRTVSDYEI